MSQYLHKDQTIYDNPAISRKLPQEFYFYFTDLQADLAIKTFNQNIKYGLSKRQSLAKILYENLNSNSRKYVPDLVQQYDNNCYWHFPIIPTQNLSNKFQEYLMGKGYDVVGYGLKLCSEDLNFVERNSNLIGAKNIHANTLFLPLFESLKPKEIIKIAKDINIFFDNR